MSTLRLENFGLVIMGQPYTLPILEPFVQSDINKNLSMINIKKKKFTLELVVGGFYLFDLVDAEIDFDVTFSACMNNANGVVSDGNDGNAELTAVRLSKGQMVTTEFVLNFTKRLIETSSKNFAVGYNLSATRVNENKRAAPLRRWAGKQRLKL